MRRLRRRTFGPSGPAIHPEQVALVLLTIAAIAAGAWFVLEFL